MNQHIRDLVGKLTAPIRIKQRCDHCGRDDLGSNAAGYAEVTTRHGILKVCDPKVLYRPRCRQLVREFGHNGHGKDCQICAFANPHGKDVFRPERGRWAHV